ncbi:MAG: (2Fe-2S) ferredoxin domain-containing protein [Ignavibacteria bacterium]|nr:(2Fe-2S) ferredoxin domain-containing protein [Ignavibacteria bacterium]
MAKLKIEDLDRIAEEARSKMTIREGAGKARITVHMGTCGIAAGARAIMSAFLDEIKAHNIKDVIITTSGCAGLCSREPMATVEFGNQAPVKYVDLTDEKARKIFKEHVLGGKFVMEYALSVGSERIR